jgi:hypothetical protein
MWLRGTEDVRADAAAILFAETLIRLRVSVTPKEK